MKSMTRTWKEQSRVSSTLIIAPALSNCALSAPLSSGRQRAWRRETYLSTVIRGREQGDELSLCKELVSVFYDLMRSADQIHIVLLQKARDDVGSESKRDTSIVFTPPGDILVGVGPEEVTE